MESDCVIRVATKVVCLCNICRVICAAADQRVGEDASVGEAAEHQNQCGATAQRSE